MFGFDESIEYKKSPQDEVKDACQQLMDTINGLRSYDAKSLQPVFELFDVVAMKANALAPTEQSKIGMYISSIKTMKPTLMQLLPMGKVMEGTIQMQLGNVSGTWCPNIIAALN